MTAVVAALGLLQIAIVSAILAAKLRERWRLSSREPEIIERIRLLFGIGVSAMKDLLVFRIYFRNQRMPCSETTGIASLCNSRRSASNEWAMSVPLRKKSR
jgi:hypothetical protein